MPAFGLGLWFLISLGYRDSFLMLNGQPTWLGDLLFPHITNLGDSVIACSLLALYAWRRDAALVVVAILAIAASGIAAQLLKNLVFADWPRPLTVFGENQVHHFAHERLYHKSFPSGHSTTATCAGLAWAYALRQRQWLLQLGASGLGLIIVFSRVYIGVHFVGDAMAGVALGMAITLPLYYYFYPRVQNWVGSWPAQLVPRIHTGMLVLAVICFTVAVALRYKHWWLL